MILVSSCAGREAEAPPALSPTPPVYPAFLPGPIAQETFSPTAPEGRRLANPAIEALALLDALDGRDDRQAKQGVAVDPFDRGQDDGEGRVSLDEPVGLHEHAVARQDLV